MKYFIKHFAKTIIDKYYRIKVSSEIEIAKENAKKFDFHIFREQILNYLEKQRNSKTNLFSFQYLL